MTRYAELNMKVESLLECAARCKDSYLASSLRAKARQLRETALTMSIEEASAEVQK